MKANKHLLAITVTMGLWGAIANAQQPTVNGGTDQTEKQNREVAHAQQADETKAVAEAEAKLKASFSQLNVTSFGPSPIPGIYEIQTGANLLYFSPENEEHEGIIFMGEMYNKNGESLTEKSKSRLMSKNMKNLDFSSAISIGPANAPAFYEVTDPDCPYCHAYDGWLKEIDKDSQLHRKLLFMVNPGHPLAKSKIEHIICSPNKDEAVKYAFSDALPHNSLDSATPVQLQNYKGLKTCKEAEGVIAQHQKLISALGVNGTPSFLFGADTDNPVKVVGFDKNKILENILKIKNTTTTTTVKK